MIKYVIELWTSTGAPMGVQYYEYKSDAMQAVAHFVGRGYRVEIHKF